MAQEISGVKTKRMREEITIARLLRSWIEIVDTYNNFNLVDKRKLTSSKVYDVGYVYNERANVSLLAAAAWRSGLIALEEYPTKRWGNKKGRADLFFSSLTTGFEAEAKIIWPAYKKAEPFSAENEAKLSAKIRTDIEEKLQEAFDAAKGNLASDRGHRLGICFICPVVRVEKYKWEALSFRNVEPFIEFVVQEAAKIPHHAMAWVFPSSSRNYLDYNTKGERGFYPGVIVMIRQVDN